MALPLVQKGISDLTGETSQVHFTSSPGLAVVTRAEP